MGLRATGTQGSSAHGASFGREAQTLEGNVTVIVTTFPRTMPPAASRRRCAVSGPDRFKISELAVSFDAVELAPLAAPGPCS